jgi:hypothetical protein
VRTLKQLSFISSALSGVLMAAMSGQNNPNSLMAQHLLRLKQQKAVEAEQKAIEDKVF